MGCSDALPPRVPQNVSLHHYSSLCYKYYKRQSSRIVGASIKVSIAPDWIRCLLHPLTKHIFVGHKNNNKKKKTFPLCAKFSLWENNVFNPQCSVCCWRWSPGESLSHNIVLTGLWCVNIAKYRRPFWQLHMWHLTGWKRQDELPGMPRWRALLIGANYVKQETAETVT